MRPPRATKATNAMPTDGMSESTGIPLAIAPGCSPAEEITATGVIAPEAVIDPNLFFERLPPFGPELDGALVLDIPVVND